MGLLLHQLFSLYPIVRHNIWWDNVSGIINIYINYPTYIVRWCYTPTFLDSHHPFKFLITFIDRGSALSHLHVNGTQMELQISLYNSVAARLTEKPLKNLDQSRRMRPLTNAML